MFNIINYSHKQIRLLAAIGLNYPRESIVYARARAILVARSRLMLPGMTLSPMHLRESGLMLLPSGNNIEK